MERYYYLIYSFFFLLLLVSALFYRRDLRRYTYPAILFGIVAGPISQLLYLGDYWHPLTLFGNARISIEDSIFGASIFGLAFICYPLLCGYGFHVPEVRSAVQHRRFFACVGVGAALLVILSLAGINSVIATAILFISLWVGILWYRHDLFRPGLVTGFAFTLLAAFVYGVGFSVISTQTLADTWLLHGKHLGTTLADKIPVTELVWFFATGCFLSVFDLFTSGKHYKPLDDRGGRPSNLANPSSKAGTPESR